MDSLSWCGDSISNADTWAGGGVTHVRVWSGGPQLVGGASMDAYDEDDTPVLVACRASSFAHLRFGYPARLGLNCVTWSDVPKAERVKMGVTKEISKNAVL